MSMTPEEFKESFQKNISVKEYRWEFIRKCFQDPRNYNGKTSVNHLHLTEKECENIMLVIKLIPDVDINTLTYAVHNIEMVEYLVFELGVERSNITFIYDRPDKSAFASLYNVERMAVGNYFRSRRKWDVVVCLPPFRQSRYIEHLIWANNKSNILSYVITPSIWLLANRSSRKKYIIARESLSERNCCLELFNGCEMIQNRFPMPMLRVITSSKYEEGITFNNKIFGTSFHYDSIYSIDKYGNSPTYISLYNKIMDKLSSGMSIDSFRKFQNTKDNRFFVNIAGIRGHSITASEKFYNKDYFTFLPDDSIVEDSPRFQSVGFDNKAEAENFLEYLRSDIARFCLSIVKNNPHLNRGELSRIPYPIELDQFGFTEEELSFIKDRMEFYSN